MATGQLNLRQWLQPQAGLQVDNEYRNRDGNRSQRALPRNNDSRRRYASINRIHCTILRS